MTSKRIQPGKRIQPNLVHTTQMTPMDGYDEYIETTTVIKRYIYHRTGAKYRPKGKNGKPYSIRLNKEGEQNAENMS